MTGQQEILFDEKKCKVAIEMGNALERLQKNDDFVAVINKGYLEDEAIRLVHVKAAAFMQSPDKQLEITKAIDGIGCLLGYFRAINYMANDAQRTLEEGHKMMNEAEFIEGEV